MAAVLSSPTAAETQPFLIKVHSPRRDKGDDEDDRRGLLDGEIKPEVKLSILTLLPLTLLQLLGAGLILPYMPQLKIHFFGGSARAAKISGIFDSLANFFGFFSAPVVGKLSDCYGRKPLIVFIVIVGNIPLLMLLLFPENLYVYYGSYLLVGIAGAGVGSNSLFSAYLADIYPGKKRIVAFGRLMGIAGVGLFLGPLVSLIFSYFSVPQPFGVLCLVANILSGVSILLALLLPESLPQGNRARFAMSDANPCNNVLSLMTNDLVCCLGLILFFTGLAEGGMTASLWFYLDVKFGIDAKTNAIMLLLVGVFAFIVQIFLLKPLLEKTSELFVLFFSLSLTTLHIFLYAIAWSRWVVYVNCAMASLTFIASPAISGMLSRHLSKSDQGMGLGVLASVRGVTTMVGPVLFGYLYSVLSQPPFDSPAAVLYIGTFLTLIPLILAAAWLPKALKQAEEALLLEKALAAAKEGVPLKVADPFGRRGEDDSEEWEETLKEELEEVPRDVEQVRHL